MSNTTTINSKAIQTLLAQSENRLGPSSGSGGAAHGASFHQLLEKAVNDDASDLTSPSTLAASALTDHSPTGNSAQRFAHALAGAVARHPMSSAAAKQLPARPEAGAGTGGQAASTRGAKSATASGGKADGLLDPGGTDDTAGLDVTQTKVVNAPALPERPPSTARELTLQGQARAQSDGATKAGTSGATQEPGAAGPASPATGANSRGFAAVLATAHTSASVPTSLVDQASFDPSLRMTVAPQGAHLSLDTGVTGALTAQLQITNGVADVRMTGEAAAVLARHGAELSLGLTAAGLQPGRVEITPTAAAADLQSATSDGSGTGNASAESGAHDDSNPQPDEQSSRSAKPSAAASTLSTRTSRVHVKA